MSVLCLCIQIGKHENRTSLYNKCILRQNGSPHKSTFTPCLSVLLNEFQVSECLGLVNIRKEPSLTPSESAPCELGPEDLHLRSPLRFPGRPLEDLGSKYHLIVTDGFRPRIRPNHVHSGLSVKVSLYLVRLEKAKFCNCERTHTVNFDGGPL